MSLNKNYSMEAKSEYIRKNTITDKRMAEETDELILRNVYYFMYAPNFIDKTECLFFNPLLTRSPGRIEEYQLFLDRHFAGYLSLEKGYKARICGIDIDTYYGNRYLNDTRSDLFSGRKICKSKGAAIRRAFIEKIQAEYEYDHGVSKVVADMEAANCRILEQWDLDIEISTAKLENFVKRISDGETKGKVELLEMPFLLQKKILALITEQIRKHTLESLSSAITWLLIASLLRGYTGDLENYYRNMGKKYEYSFSRKTAKAQDDIERENEYRLNAKTPVEKRIHDLEVKVNGILEMDNLPNHKVQTIATLHSNSVLTNYNFIGRENELYQLENVLRTDRAVFLYGIGGNGKTEIAKRYLKIHANDYDTIVFAQYGSTLQDLIVSDKYFVIDGFERLNEGDKTENDERYSRRKLAKIKATSTKNTLIILDNFDTEGDPLLEDFLDGPYKIIITTRTNFDFLGIPIIHVGNLEDKEQILLFTQYYKRVVKEEEYIYIKKILSYLCGHTLTIELIAKLMFSKRITPEKMILQLEEVGISPKVSGKINHGFSKATTIYSYIQKLFCMNTLSDTEKYIMTNLSLLPVSGVLADDFISWCGLEDGEVIGELISRSWIQYDIETDFISLHPVIADVVRNECSIDFVICGEMLYNLDKKFRFSWSMKKEKRIEYGEIAKTLYFRCGEILKDHLYSLRAMLFLFKYLDSYDFVQKLFAEMKAILGDKESIELAWWYYDLGDFEIHCHHYDTAIECLITASNMLRKIYPKSYDMAHILKHLAHTYHTVYQKINPDKVLLKKARECLDESSQIFDSCANNSEKTWGSSCYTYAIDFEKELKVQLGSRYYAYGLNYYLMEEYEKAEKYEEQSLEILMDTNGENDSDTTAPMRVLAMIYSKTGRYEKAIDMEKRVIQIRSNLWGTNQSWYFEQFETLADIYFEYGKRDEAIKELQHAIDLAGYDNENYISFLNRMHNKMEKYAGEKTD